MSEDEIKHPLATLMKQKYGVTRQSSLRLNSDDSLFVAFRKIANYIYKNGEWNDGTVPCQVYTLNNKN